MLAGEASWDDVRGALREHAAFIRRFVAEQGVQTNEVQRSWMLLPCFLAAVEASGADAVDVVELGPSAGLNLVWDRHRYRYEAGPWGPEGAPLELRGEGRALVPARLLARAPRVRSRVGVDAAPIDVATEDGALLLRSFVWPDQAWRLERLDRAIEAVRADPPELVRGDVADVLPRLLAERRRDALTLVFATAVLGYLPDEGRERVLGAIRAAAEEGGVAYVSTGRPPDGAHTHYGLWLLDARGRRLLARADFHGAWIEWAS